LHSRKFLINLCNEAPTLKRSLLETITSWVSALRTAVLKLLVGYIFPKTCQIQTATLDSMPLPNLDPRLHHQVPD
ncbi:hypothetical protein AMECASPLE_024621, partial [Ameca splendens]